MILSNSACISAGYGGSIGVIRAVDIDLACVANVRPMEGLGEADSKIEGVAQVASRR